jgi:hypothetical protein
MVRSTVQIILPNVLIKLMVSEVNFWVGTGKSAYCIEMMEKECQLFVVSHKNSPEDIWEK